MQFFLYKTAIIVRFRMIKHEAESHYEQVCHGITRFDKKKPQRELWH